MEEVKGVQCDSSCERRGSKGAVSSDKPDLEYCDNINTVRFRSSCFDRSKSRILWLRLLDGLNGPSFSHAVHRNLVSYSIAVQRSAGA